jgi:hypothetical protein
MDLSSLGIDVKLKERKKDHKSELGFIKSPCVGITNPLKWLFKMAFLEFFPPCDTRRLWESTN